MPELHPAEAALRQSGRLIRYATGTVLLALFTGIFSTDLSGGLLGLGFILALIAIGIRLFCVIQLQLSDLLALVAVLGNFFGGVAYLFQDVRHAPTLALLTLGVFVWLMAGITNGLLIAQKLKKDTFSEHVELAGVFLCYPIGIAVALAAVPAAVVSIASGSGLLLVIVVGSGSVGGLVWSAGSSWKKAAHLAVQLARRSN